MGTSDVKQTILIIDDNKDFLDIFSTKLTSEGYTVITAASGGAGIAEAEKSKPDLILLDVEMPGMSGIETLQKLKGNPVTAKLKVAFLTNYGETKQDVSWLDEKFAREAGAMDYIRKSDDLSNVVVEVKKLCKPLS